MTTNLTSLRDSSNVGRFGLAECALCGATFAKKRRGQLYCSREHLLEAIKARKGQPSGDAKWRGRRERDLRVRQARRERLSEVLRNDPELLNENSQTPLAERPGVEKYPNLPNDLEKLNELNGLRRRKRRVEPPSDGLLLVRAFGDGRSVLARHMAARLKGGVAVSYVVGLLQGLAVEPVDGCRAEHVEGTGSDAVWRIVPLDGISRIVRTVPKPKAPTAVEAYRQRRGTPDPDRPRDLAGEDF